MTWNGFYKCSEWAYNAIQEVPELRDMRVIAVAMLVILLIIGLAAEWRVQNATLVRIPEQIRDTVLEWYGKEHAQGIVFRAYAVMTDCSFVVTEYNYPPGAGKVLDFFQLDTSGKMAFFAPQEVRLGNDKFEVNCLLYWDYSERPYQQFAAGVALDKKSARIVGTTADGRTQEAYLFDGYWWMSSDLDPNDYEKDKWIKITLYDAEGKILDERVPKYPEFGSGQ